MSIVEKIKPEIIKPKKMGLLVEILFINLLDIPGAMMLGLTQQRIHWLPEEVPLRGRCQRLAKKS